MTTELTTVPQPALARYRKLVFQVAGLAAAVLGAFIDATTNGGIVTGVTWLLAVGAALQVALTYWPTSSVVKFAASALGVAFSGLAAGLTDGFTNAEVMLLAWQLTMWLGAGAVDNAPQPVTAGRHTAWANEPGDVGQASIALITFTAVMLASIAVGLIAAIGVTTAARSHAWTCQPPACADVRPAWPQLKPWQHRVRTRLELPRPWDRYVRPPAGRNWHVA